MPAERKEFHLDEDRPFDSIDESRIFVYSTCVPQTSDLYTMQEIF